MTEITERDAAHWALEMLLRGEGFMAQVGFSYEEKYRLKSIAWNGVNFYSNLSEVVMFTTLKEVIKHNEAAIWAWKEGQTNE